MPSFFIFHYEVFNIHGIGIYHQKNGAFQIGSSAKLQDAMGKVSYTIVCLWFDENITFAVCNFCNFRRVHAYFKVYFLVLCNTYKQLFNSQTSFLI